nr:autotransporter-associated beta strand repeat-containing protein [uncultured Flavobacterium sp.]
MNTIKISKLLFSTLFLWGTMANAQHLTISNSGETTSPGTNWSIIGNVLYIGNSGSASINTSVITNHLQNTGDLTINLPEQSNVARNIYINNTIAYLGSSARTLTFQSGNDIVFANTVGITSATASLNIVLRSATTTGTPDNGSIKMDGINIDTKGGHLWVGGGATTTTWNGLSVGNSSARTYLDDVAGISVVGSTIASGGGNIYMYGLSWNSSDDDGVNYGINVENSTVSSGSGAIYFKADINGRYTNGIGMRVIGTTSITSTSGAISIFGYGYDGATNGNSWRQAASIQGSAQIKSVSGNITVGGDAAFTATVNDKEGLMITDGAAICSQSGNISLRGTNTLESSGQYSNSIRFAAANIANSIRIGYDGTNAYSGNISIEGNSIYQRNTNAGGGSIAVQTTGTLTIQPTGTAFTYMRAGNSGTLTYDDDWNFGTTLGGFTFGKTTNTTNITLSNPLTTDGPISIYGGNILAQQNITSTLPGADILLQATGAINLSASRTIQTSGGDVTLNATSGGTATSADSAIYLYGSSQILSNGGNITLGGGYSGTEGNLYAATNISGGGYAVRMDASSIINAAGGNISIYGRNVSSYGDGIYLNTVNISTIGSGTIGIYGDSYGGYNGTTFFGGVTFENNASIIQNVNGNITLKGMLTQSQSTQGYGINFYRTTGSAGQTRHIQILSQTGDIQITGDRGSTTGGGIGHSSWGNIYFGSPSDNSFTASGDVVLTYSNLVNAGSNGFKVKTTGAVTYEPVASSFIVAQTFPANSNYILADNATSLTIGKTGNTAGVTIGSNISIAGPISVYAGTITLNANLTSTNTTTGNINLNGTTISGTGNMVLADGRTAEVNVSSASTYDGIISGSGSGLTKLGAGMLTLTKDHTYSGATTISGGDLQVGTGGSVSQASSGTINATSDVSIASGSKLILTPNENVVFAAPISGAGGVEIKGASGKYFPSTGTSWLTTSPVQLVANTTVLEALTRITGGKMGGTAISNGTAICVAYQKSYTALNNTATLQLQAFNGDSSNSYTKCVFLKLTQSGSNVIIQVDNSKLSTGAGYKNGSVLGTDISIGGLSMTLSTSGGSGYGISEVFMSGKVNFTGLLSYSGNTVLSNTVSSSTATYTGYNYTSKGTQEITDASSSFPSSSTVVNNGLVILNRTTPLTIASNMEGTEEVLQVGADITLTGTNTHTGITTIDLNKKLNIGSGSTTGSITGNVVNYGTLTFDRSDASTHTGVISGSGSLVKSGAGAHTLTGLNTYTGATTINAGKLVLERDVPITSSSSYSGAGTLVIQPSSSSFTSAVSYPIAGFTVSNAIGGLTIGKLTNTANITFGNTTTIAGPITAYGGTITLNANLTTTNSGNISLYTDNPLEGLSTARTLSAAGAFKYIPRGTAFTAAVTYPIANLSATCSGLTIGNVTNDKDITINANVEGGAGIELYGNNLAINSNLKTTSSADMYLKGNTTIASEKYIESNGDFTHDGNLIFKSDAMGTAAFGALGGTFTTVSGLATVERYIPAKRAWRLLNAPLKGATNTTVTENWQGVNGEGLLLFSPATYQSQTMTGYTLGGGMPNIWKYNNGWQAIPNLTNENLFTTTGTNGFLVFATGTSDSNTIVLGETATTLKPQGQLITGAVVNSIIGNQYNLVPNPYASALNTETMVQANAGSTVWMVDPSLGNFGGYTTYDGTNWAPTTPTVSDKNIQSGQAFFVRTASNSTFSITESHKISGSSNTWFSRTANSPADKIRVLLYKQDNAEWKLADGILAVNSASGNNEVDNTDTGKMSNFNENLLFRNGTSNLAIEYRGLPTAGTTQPMRLTGTTVQPYQLKVKAESYTNTNLQPYIQDTQLGTVTAIPTDGSEIVLPFTGVAASSTNPDSRFIIIYLSTLSTNNPDVLSVGVYPNPVSTGVFTVSLKENTTPANYSLTNLLGQQVQVGKLMSLNNSVNVTSLQIGIYILQVEQEGKTFSTKLIIK